MLTTDRRGHGYRTLLGALALTATAGCATLPPPIVETAEANCSRAELVFRYQSRVADALLDHYPLLDVFEEADPVLVAAEARMTESCSPLTRAVLSELEGERPSLGLRWRVFTSLDECQRAARRIERLLETGSATGSQDANGQNQSI